MQNASIVFVSFLLAVAVGCLLAALGLELQDAIEKNPAVVDAWRGH